MDTMIHRMNILESGFKVIKTGSKTIEVRLNNSKRQGIKKGDEIEFSKLLERKEKVRVTVLKTEKFYSFDDLLKAYPLDKFGSEGRFSTKEEYLKILRAIYPDQREREQGVLAIHIQLIEE